MKFRHVVPAICLSVACILGAGAQAPSNAPAGSTGKCKDGSYTNTSSRTGACSSHQGLAQWYGGGAPAASATVTGRATPAPPPKEIPPKTLPPLSNAKPRPDAQAAPAPGGGPGMVWLNADSKVYHCPGGRYYGKTKQGKYVTEAQAQKMGARPEGGKACSSR